MSPLSVMPLPVTAKAPEVIPTTETAPYVLNVRLLVLLANALLAVIEPPPEVVLLRIVTGSVKV